MRKRLNSINQQSIDRKIPLQLLRVDNSARHFSNDIMCPSISCDMSANVTQCHANHIGMHAYAAYAKRNKKTKA